MEPTINQILQQAVTAHQEGKTEKAEKLYKKILEAEPKNPDVNNNMGALLQNLGRLDEAEKSYRKAIEIKPDYAEAHNNLGSTLHRLDRLDEAEKSYKKAIEIKPDYAGCYHNMGVILFKLGRLDESAEYQSKAIELSPNFKGALLNRGHILFVKGELERALQDFDTCNNSESRSRSLFCLNALGRTKDIYNRIEMNSDLDDENIAVAAFSAFISKKESKITAHKFCNNPLDFIKVSNLSSHFKDKSLFISEVIEELHKVKTKWEPSGKTTKKGFQSIDNLFDNSSEKIQNLKSIIIDEIDSYYLKFKNESCSFIKKWPSKKNLRGWHVTLKQQGYQDPHIHTSGWLSGVIYLKVVPTLDKNEGAIQFSLNGEYYFDNNSPKITHEPKVGDIILFPSSLHHRTIPFTTDTDRIIVSFDLMPNTKKIK